jgi:steroid delta-isomerase-like uncharacterized protein/uncharacterized protein (TIGR02246 family)
MKRFVVLFLLVASVAFAQEPNNVNLIQQFDAAWNARDLPAIIAFFSDDATLTSPDGKLYTGKTQIEEYVKSLLPGFRVETSAVRASGDKAMWSFTVHSDAFAQMGVNPAKGEAVAEIMSGKIKSFSPSLSQETQNKLAIQQGISNYNNPASRERYFDLYSENCVFHDPSVQPGLVGIKQFYNAFWIAFPDLKVQIDDMVAEGDRVSARFFLTATQQGDFMGIPASGKSIEVGGQTILRFENGKCVERWTQLDNLTMMQQLGALPQAANK